MRDHTSESASERRRFLEAYVATLPALAAEFDSAAGGRSAATDGTMSGLVMSNRLFLEELVSTTAEPTFDLPIWWQPGAETAENDPHSPFTRFQLHWIDVYQAHVALTLQRGLNASWMSYKGGRRDFRNGDPVLQFAGGVTVNVTALIYGEALKVVAYERSIPDTFVRDFVIERLGIESLPN